MSAEVALEGVHGLVRIIVSICQEEAPPPLAQPPAQPMSPVLAAVREAAMLFLQSEERGRDMQPMMQALIRICHHEGAVATCIKTMRVCAHEPVLLTQCCRLLMLASRSEVCKSLIVAKGGISAIVAALKHHQAFAKLQVIFCFQLQLVDLHVAPAKRTVWFLTQCAGIWVRNFA